MATTDPGPLGAVNSVSTADLTSPGAAGARGDAPPLYSGGIPEPEGSTSAGDPGAAGGTGVEGETIVWDGRYSPRNFVGRVLARAVLTICWGALAFYTWGQGHENIARLTWLAGVVLGVAWLYLGLKMIQAHYTLHYRLSNLRLFHSTGIVSRRRDMMELLRVKDVFTRQQSLLERWLGVGTVVVVPTEKELPTFYLAGVADPKQVMDLVWHHARAERDMRSVKVDSV